jgi:uncharacterized protein with PIN domain
LVFSLGVQVVPCDQHHLNWAPHGWRHYGLAMALDLPLLFNKGDDFARTEVKVALSW